MRSDPYIGVRRAQWALGALEAGILGIGAAEFYATEVDVAKLGGVAGGAPDVGIVDVGAEMREG